jgi:hypothetical protein
LKRFRQQLYRSFVGHNEDNSSEDISVPTQKKSDKSHRALEQSTSDSTKLTSTLCWACGRSGHRKPSVFLAREIIVAIIGKTAHCWNQSMERGINPLITLIYGTQGRPRSKVMVYQMFIFIPYRKAEILPRRVKEVTLVSHVTLFPITVTV